MTKATITGPEGGFTCLFIMYNTPCSPDPEETDALLKLDLLNDIGITSCKTLPQHGGYCGIWVDDDKLFIPFQTWFNPEYKVTREIFFNISMPTEQDYQTLPQYELNSKDFWSPRYYRIDENGNKIKKNGAPLSP